MDKILQVQHLYKSYSRKQVLEDFNMSLERGKVFGLLGNNGEGKTTLIRIIMGIIPADQGRILYDGRAISFNQPAYKKEVAYIPEESIFFSWMSRSRRRSLMFQQAGHTPMVARSPVFTFRTRTMALPSATANFLGLYGPRLSLDIRLSFPLHIIRLKPSIHQ